MNHTGKEFLRRGISACGLGPIVLAVLYLILQHSGVLQTLTVQEVCIGIVSLSALAFIAGGMNVIYQIEQLPLMAAILIHGGVLYLGYLIVYLVNRWLAWSVVPLLIFTGIFVVGYLLIWIGIYTMTKRKTARLNEKLMERQQAAAGRMEPPE